MGNFVITQSQLNNQFNYTDVNVIITGAYTSDAQTSTLQNINGQAYRNNEGQQGEYIGNFSGFLRNGDMKYSLSEMTRSDADMVLDALADIESKIIVTPNAE